MVGRAAKCDARKRNLISGQPVTYRYFVSAVRLHQTNHKTLWLQENQEDQGLQKLDTCLECLGHCYLPQPWCYHGNQHDKGSENPRNLQQTEDDNSKDTDGFFFHQVTNTL